MRAINQGQIVHARSGKKSVSICYLESCSLLAALKIIFLATCRTSQWRCRYFQPAPSGMFNLEIAKEFCEQIILFFHPGNSFYIWTGVRNGRKERKCFLKKDHKNHHACHWYLGKREVFFWCAAFSLAVSTSLIRYFDVGLLPCYHLVCVDKEGLLTIFHFLVRSIKTP